MIDRGVKDILVADVEKQSMLAAKTGAKAKTVSMATRRSLIRARAEEGLVCWSTNSFVWRDMNYSSWPVKTKTQVSIFIQQQTGSHHSVSPEYILSAAMIPGLVRCSGSVVMCGSKIYDRQFKDILVADVEKQSMLAAKTGAKAKTVSMATRRSLIA